MLPSISQDDHAEEEYSSGEEDFGVIAETSSGEQEKPRFFGKSSQFLLAQDITGIKSLAPGDVEDKRTPWKLSSCNWMPPAVSTYRYNNHSIHPERLAVDDTRSFALRLLVPRT